MGIENAYIKKYLNKINLNEPFLKQIFIEFKDIKELIPHYIIFRGSYYKVEIVDYMDQFKIRYKTAAKVIPDCFNTEFLYHNNQTHIYEDAVRGIHNWLTSLKEYDKEVFWE